MTSEPFVFQILAPPPRRPAEEVHAEAMARGARCRECPLWDCGRGPVMGEVRPNAKLTIVGEAPGENEVEAKRPFVGWSGQILNVSMAEGGLSRTDCSITNTILCQPPEGGNYKAFIDQILQRWKREVKRAIKRGENPPLPPLLPQQACAPRLARDIAESNAKVVLAVGKQGLEASARELGVAQGAAHVQPGEPYCASIKKQHGAPILLQGGRVLMSSYHPAMAAPGRDKAEYLPVIRENLTRAAWIAKHAGYVPWSEPQYHLNPTVADVLAFCNQLLATRAEVTVDIETRGIDPYASDTQIRCVGIGARLGPEGRTEKIMVVPFRHMDGTDWWPTQEAKLEVAYALRAVIDENPLVMQNGNFDTSMMLAKGLMTNRTKSWTDTMLLHHDTPDNDLPHDLGFIARRYFCVPMWKSDIDHKSIDNVNDQTLHLYNARDVLITQRLVEPLRQTIDQYNTWTQYDTDYKLAPVLREMGHLGLVIDEKRRGEFSEMLNWQCQRELYRFRELVKKPNFNPRSVPKLQELLFQEWGYVPVVGTDGYELREEAEDRFTWKADMLREADADREEIEDEVGSTSSGALIELKRRREMKPEHVEAIDCLLEYRAYDKLRGTYVDNMPVRDVAWETFGYAVGYVDPVAALIWDDKASDYVLREVIRQRRALSLLNTVYKGHVIPTGRLATQPAVQNWPALGKANMRDMVVAPPGHVLVGADYAQLEARLYAVAANDLLLLEAIRTKKDIHSMNAAALLAKNLSELEYWYEKVEKGDKKYRKYWRTVAKRFAFLEIYGGEVDELFRVMSQQRNKEDGLLSFPELTKDDVKTWHENWHKLHPWTRLWHERCHAMYEQTGYASVPAIDYRKRFFLGGLSRKNAVPNMTIQGFAASIANRALLRLVDAIPFRSWSPWTGVCLQVHDFLGLYVPAEKAEYTKKVLEDCMYYEHNGVPFPAEGAISTRWSKQD